MALSDSAEERSLSERVVKEAVERGLETPMREPILEAVDESDAGRSSARRLPIAGVLVGVGAAIGYAAARFGSLDEVLEQELPETVEEAVEEPPVEVEPPAEESGGGSGLLRKAVLALGVIGAVALIRRQLGGRDEPEWEPIEEFEPDTTAESEFAGPAGTTDVEEEDVEGETAEASDEDE